jgi:hypothetical protein
VLAKAAATAINQNLREVGWRLTGELRTIEGLRAEVVMGFS